MSEKQPPQIAEGAQTATTEEENPPLASNAEDRKAASALASLDSKAEGAPSSQNVDQEAVQNAIKNLSGAGKAPKKAAAAGLSKKTDDAPKKPLVKVDAADVTVVMEECEFNKVRATDFLRTHEGDLGSALRAFVTPA